MSKIRRCKLEDERQSLELISGIMNDEFHEDAAAYPLDDLQDISSTYGGIGEAFFVAVDEDRVIGTVGIKKEDDRIALLRRLFVAPEYRNRKIGVKLIDHALSFCEELGYEELVFRTTSKMSRAIDLCKKKGFAQRAKLELGSVELYKFVLLLKSLSAK